MLIFTTGLTESKMKTHGEKILSMFFRYGLSRKWVRFYHRHVIPQARTKWKHFSILCSLIFEIALRFLGGKVPSLLPLCRSLDEEEYGTVKRQWCGKTLPQSHFAHHKYHRDWQQSNPGCHGEMPATNLWAMIRPLNREVVVQWEVLSQWPILLV